PSGPHRSHRFHRNIFDCSIRLLYYSVGEKYQSVYAAEGAASDIALFVSGLCAEDGYDPFYCAECGRGGHYGSGYYPAAGAAACAGAAGREKPAGYADSL